MTRSRGATRWSRVGARSRLVRTARAAPLLHPGYPSSNLFPEGDTSPILQEASLGILSLSDSVCQTGIATGNAVESKLCAYSDSGDACQVGEQSFRRYSAINMDGQFPWLGFALFRACAGAEFTQPGDHGFACNLNLD